MTTVLTAPRQRAVRTSSRLLVVINGRASATGDAERLLAEVTRGLETAGGRAHGRITATEAELAEAIDGARARRVVLVGGDGTLHAAVNLGIALPELALIPAGRANNVARALDIPFDVAAAARTAVHGLTRPVDVLRVESEAGVHYAIEGVSAGFQADARGRYDGENSADLRRGAAALASTLRRYRPYPVDLWVDGRPGFAGDAAQVFLSNLPFFGFGFRVNPAARPADGLLEAIVVEADSRRGVVSSLVSAYRGGLLRHRGVRMRRARRAVIESALPPAADGTPLGRDVAAVMVEQGRLRVAA